MKREEILKWARAEARSIIGLINEAPYHSTHEHTAIIAAAIVEILEADRAEREAAVPGLKGLIDGTHVVVPRKPTMEMIEAGVDAGFEAHTPETKAWGWLEAVYPAMIAAAEVRDE